MNREKIKVLFFNSTVLRITFITGIILFVLTCVFLTGFYLLERSAGKTTRIQDSFSRILREYDISAGTYTGTEREYENLNRELVRLEKKAIGVESWLSVLKRRRALARLYPPSMGNYRASINRALKEYPSSQPLAALAASALIKETALNKETETALRGFLPLFTDDNFSKLRLSIHVLLGDFENPQKAAVLPEYLLSDGTESITQNLIILKILNPKSGGVKSGIDNNDNTGYNAASDIQAVINSSVPSRNFIRFAAEYNYDFGDIRRAAVLFSRLEGEWAIGRQADCFYLAGFPSSARSLWLILSAAPDERSLYNLAVTADNTQEASVYLKKIIDMDSAAFTNSRQFALIRYSRFLPGAQAVAVLEKTDKLKPSDFPFVDLEACKRKTESQQPARKIAEAWMLLDRHPENEDLYRWVSWLMVFQREYDELNILLKRHVSDNYQSSEWTKLYKSIQLMRGGETDTALDLLQEIPEDSARWYVYANRGRLFETLRSFSKALEQYNLAIEKKPEKKFASKILFNTARCYTAISRPADAILALEDAINLDSDNHSARLEYERLLF
jgi:tetratricopeptide (TPR) repeat protein